MINNCMNTKVIVPFLENLIKQIKDDNLNTNQYIDLFKFLYKFSKKKTKNQVNNTTEDNYDQMIKFLITGWYINFISKQIDKNDF